MKPDINNIVLDRTYTIEQVSGINILGQPFYAFLLIKKSMLEPFRQALQNSEVNLKEWGTVLDTGMGREPPDDVKEKILIMFPKKGSN